MDRIPAVTDTDKTYIQSTSVNAAPTAIMPAAVWHTVLIARMPAALNHALLMFTTSTLAADNPLRRRALKGEPDEKEQKLTAGKK